MIKDYDRTLDQLGQLMNLPSGMRQRIDGICRTTDGHYLARLKGGIGYDLYIGKPSPPHAGPGRDQMLRAWRGMSEDERRAVVKLADQGGNQDGDGMRIDLAREFGVPTGVTA